MQSTPAQMRKILWRLEFNRDVLLRLDRPFVQESGLVAPLPNGAYCSRKKRGRAAQALYIQYLAELADGGADLYGFGRSEPIPRLRIAKPNVGDQLTSLQPSGLTSHSRYALGMDQNGKLRGNRERRRGGDRFFRESQPERLAPFGWGSNKDYGRRRRSQCCACRRRYLAWGQISRRRTFRGLSQSRAVGFGSVCCRLRRSGRHRFYGLKGTIFWRATNKPDSRSRINVFETWRLRRRFRRRGRHRFCGEKVTRAGY